MYVNAFAIGRNTIAVTMGAIETFSSDELKGIIAHEFGHLSNGDTNSKSFYIDCQISILYWCYFVLLCQPNNIIH